MKTACRQCKQIISGEKDSGPIVYIGLCNTCAKKTGKYNSKGINTEALEKLKKEKELL